MKRCFRWLNILPILLVCLWAHDTSGQERRARIEQRLQAVAQKQLILTCQPLQIALRPVISCRSLALLQFRRQRRVRRMVRPVFRAGRVKP